MIAFDAESEPLLQQSAVKKNSTIAGADEAFFQMDQTLNLPQ
jgi:hypothetical protein